MNKRTIIKGFSGELSSDNGEWDLEVLTDDNGNMLVQLYRTSYGNRIGEFNSVDEAIAAANVIDLVDAQNMTVPKFVPEHDEG